MRIRRRSWTLVLGLLLVMSAPLAAQAPVVRAVLFYSPTCPHCHKVINEDLPPLVQRYGSSLMIVGVDVTTQNGQMMFRDAANHYGIPLTQLGVPLMVVDDQVLMGDEEIPARLPGIVDAGLARGGTSWPGLPLLHDALVAEGVIQESAPAVAADSAAAPAAGQPAPEKTAAQAPAAEEPAAEPPVAGKPATAAPAPAPSAAKPQPGTASGTPAKAEGPEASGNAPARPAPAGAATPSESGPQPAATTPAPGRQGLTTGLEGTAAASKLSMGQRFALDPMANSVALVVLLVMIGVATSALSMVRRGRSRFGAGPAWWIPLLSVMGLGIALYLSFVEVTGTEAVCGPVGDCNTVQQSTYARVLGVPVGVLGALGYVAIFLLWVLARSGSGAWRERAAAGLWSATFTGVLFSIYLTFLEPFVIGASCAWCLGSAIVMTLLLIAATGVLGSIRRPARGAPSSQPPALV